MPRNERRSRTLVYLGGIVALVAVAIAIFASWILYNQTITLLTENLRERLLSISVTAAANIDPVALSHLKTEADPMAMEFVADAESINPYANLDEDPSNDVDANKDGVIEPDGADKLQWP